MSAAVAPDAPVVSLRWGEHLLAPAKPGGAVSFQEVIVCPLTGPAALAVEVLAEGGPDGEVGLAAKLRVDDWRFEVTIDRQAMAANGGDLRGVLLAELKRALAREAERLEGDLDAMLDPDGEIHQSTNDYNFTSPAAAEESGAWGLSFPPMSYGAYAVPQMVAAASPGRGYMEATPARGLSGYVMGGHSDSPWDQDRAAGAAYAPLAIPGEGRADGANLFAGFDMLALGSPAQLAAEALLRAKEILHGLGGGA